MAGALAASLYHEVDWVLEALPRKPARSEIEPSDLEISLNALASGEQENNQAAFSLSHIFGIF